MVTRKCLPSYGKATFGGEIPTAFNQCFERVVESFYLCKLFPSLSFKKNLISWKVKGQRQVQSRSTIPQAVLLSPTGRTERDRAILWTQQRLLTGNTRDSSHAPFQRDSLFLLPCVSPVDQLIHCPSSLDIGSCFRVSIRARFSNSQRPSFVQFLSQIQTHVLSGCRTRKTFTNSVSF